MRQKEARTGRTSETLPSVLRGEEPFITLRSKTSRNMVHCTLTLTTDAPRDLLFTELLTSCNRGTHLNFNNANKTTTTTKKYHMYIKLLIVYDKNNETWHLNK